MIDTYKDVKRIIKGFYPQDYKKIPASLMSETLFFMLYNKNETWGFVIGGRKTYIFDELLLNYNVEMKPGLQEFKDLNVSKIGLAVDINSLKTNVYKFYLKRNLISEALRNRYKITPYPNEDTTVFYYDAEKDEITHYKHYLYSDRGTHHTNELIRISDKKIIDTQKCIIEETHLFFNDSKKVLDYIDKDKYMLASSRRDGNDSYTYLYIRPKNRRTISEADM